MRLLLDTHVLLWWLSDNPRLDPQLRTAIVDGENDVFVSSISIAEIAIKRSQGKLEAPPELLSRIAEEGFTELPFSSDHAAALEALPWIHRDPFDRMLVVQAQREGLMLATADRRLRDYDVVIASAEG